MTRILLIFIFVIVVCIFAGISLNDVQKALVWLFYPAIQFANTELFQLRTKHPLIYLSLAPILVFVTFYKFTGVWRA